MKAGRIRIDDALRNADSVNDLQIAIKLNSKHSQSRDLTAVMARLSII